jgi:2-oxoglutarate ferredoxin oxidoreductase subunit gamma
MAERVIIAGFGGQGVLLMGQLLAKAGMTDGKHTVWLPSYGPEMRGGTANCSVIVSDDEIFSPIVTKATSVIVMNRPSLEKFESAVVPGGKLFINSSIIDIPATRTDIEVYYVPCNEIANELGFATVSNMVMLGAYLEKCPCVAVESALKALLEKLGERKAHLLPLNREAFAKGAAAV